MAALRPPCSAVHALFRLDETGLFDKDQSALAWQPLIHELKIARPMLWSLA